MGRKKAEFPKSKFILEKSTTNTVYEHAIYLRYIVDDKRAIKITSIFVPENQLNTQAQEVRNGYTLAVRLNK